MPSVFDKFEHQYDFEPLDWLQSGDPPPLYFPGASPRGGHEGIAVKFIPRTVPAWVGVFSFGGGPFKRGVFTCPDPHKVAILSDGALYVVNVENPGDCSTYEYAVNYVEQIVRHNLLIFCDCVNIYALGKTGLDWQIKGLNDSEITKIENDTIFATEWGPGHTVGLTVDVRDGKILTRG